MIVMHSTSYFGSISDFRSPFLLEVGSKIQNIGFTLDPNLNLDLICENDLGLDPPRFHLGPNLLHPQVLSSWKLKEMSS